MPSPDLFLDSSALFAGAISPSGAARALLVLAEAGVITITVSEQVVAETERAVARKVPQALAAYREALRSTGLRIVRDPRSEEVRTHKCKIARDREPEEVRALMDIIAHQSDVPIVVAAMKVETDYLVTFNRRHFVDDATVAARLGLRIGTPGEALTWVRKRFEKEADGDGAAAG